MIAKKIKKFISFILIINFIVSPSTLVFAKDKDMTNMGGAKIECRVCSANINWWDNFSDPYLKDYIYTALAKNHELRQAALRTEEYRQMVREQMSYEFPQLMFSPTFARIKTAKNQLFDVETAAIRTNVYVLPLFANYEADIFLKNHDKTKSKKKEYEAVQYEEKAADIAMAADVASLYVNIIKLDKVIVTQEKINKIREQIWLLTKDRHLAGLASVYDVTYSDKLHTQSQINLNDLKRQRSLLLHQFAVYIDECPYNADSLKRGKFDDFEYNGEIPECISSQVVVMRPDLMKAEADLKRAKIDVRIARKEFLPTIPIFGSAGYNSLLLKNVFNWENVFGLVGVVAMQKLFTGGQLTANLKKQKIRYEELFEAYKQADLTAIQEINDSLCMIKFDTKKDNDNMKKVRLEASNFKLIQERYNAGIISYLDMIQFQETLLSLQTEKDNSKAQRLVDYMTLYKATGASL